LQDFLRSLFMLWMVDKEDFRFQTMMLKLNDFNLRT
jgi:hypothetical protein